MTLNDNPLVDAEKRYKLLMGRRRKLLSYYDARISVVYGESGMAEKMYINPHIKCDKASKLIGKINRELTQLEKFLKKFK